MKICIICLTWKGGMIQYTSQLANSLSKNNEVYVITSDCLEDRSYFNNNINLRYVPFPPKNKLSTGWFRYNKLVEIIKKIDPKIIHITILHPLLIPILFSIKKQIIVTIHDIKKHPGDKDFLFLFLIASWLFRKKSKKIFVHGEELKKQLLRNGMNEEKIVVMPHGDYSFFTKYKNINIVEKKNTILFFGRISRYKGLSNLIKAESLIAKYIPNINIIIAGQGSFSEFSDSVKNNRNFHIINRYIPDQEVADLFQKSSVIVLPYIEASQSGVIPIAYAFKKPVIVTNVGSIPEVVEDGVTGFIVPPRDVEALANAIVKILQDDDLRKEMGENAYKKMMAELSWDEIARKTIQVYKTVINSKENKEVND